MLIGVSVTAAVVGEQAILIRYAEKEEREKVLGQFRMASGLGGLAAPALGAGMYVVGGFFAVFLTVGIGYLFILPLVYMRLNQAREEF